MKIEKTSSITKRPVKAEGAKGVQIQWLISKADGAKNFEMRLFELQPGGYTPLHRHPHEHEIFVIEGESIFVFEGQQYNLGPEYVIFVPGDKEHCFKNTGKSPLRFLCIIPVGVV